MKVAKLTTRKARQLFHDLARAGVIGMCSETAFIKHLAETEQRIGKEPEPIEWKGTAAEFSYLCLLITLELGAAHNTTDVWRYLMKAFKSNAGNWDFMKLGVTSTRIKIGDLLPPDLKITSLKDGLKKLAEIRAEEMRNEEINNN